MCSHAPVPGEMCVPGAPLAPVPQGAATTTPGLCHGCRAAQAGRDPCCHPSRVLPLPRVVVPLSRAAPTTPPTHWSPAGPGCSSSGSGRILLHLPPTCSLWPDAPVLPGCGVPAHGASSCCLPSAQHPAAWRCRGTTSRWLQQQEQRGGRAGRGFGRGRGCPGPGQQQVPRQGSRGGPREVLLTLVSAIVCPSRESPARHWGSCAIPVLLPGDVRLCSCVSRTRPIPSSRNGAASAARTTAQHRCADPGGAGLFFVPSRSA